MFLWVEAGVYVHYGHGGCGSCGARSEKDFDEIWLIMASMCWVGCGNSKQGNEYDL